MDNDRGRSAIDEYEDLAKDLKKRFKFVGDSGAYHFLWTVSEPVPDWHEWSNAHGMSWGAKGAAKPPARSRGRKDLKKRFKFVGDSGAYHFLWTVSEPVPDWHEWSNAHGMSWGAKGAAKPPARSRGRAAPHARTR
ncbi:MAG: hypothetical protein E6H94_06635 [Chloroflexi bacterium]|nr:MAG: hypothetical protein E6H94_06635 [Chloroflexota bacterium]